MSWSAVALIGCATYAAIAAGAFWFMVSYEHQGRSGWRSARSKPRGQVVQIAWLSVIWFPLAILLLMRPFIGREQ